MKAMTVAYPLKNAIYVNLTNRCPCACTFCLRANGDGIGGSGSLWLEREPDADEIKEHLAACDWNRYREVVFCGYGEPTNALDNLIQTAKYVKSIKPDIKLRLNTNGLSDLINQKPTAKEICEYIDIISVSLNEPDSQQYDKITRNIFPGKAYDAMLQFTRECVAFGNEVHMTVVDVIGKENIEKSRKICEEIGAVFILRSFERGR